MNSSPNYPEIKKYVDSIRLIDTHEHLIQEPERLSQKVDFLATFFPHYASVDLRSAGMSEEELIMVRNPDLSLDQRWAVFKPWWERTENTGYARAVEIAARDLYGVDGVSSDTYKVLSERIREKNIKGLYKWVMKDRAGIDVSINDTEVHDVDTDFFAPVRRFSEFLGITDRLALEVLEKQVGSKIHSFNDLLSVLRAEFERTQGKIYGVKIGLAYTRPIFFEKVSFSAAEEAFNELFQKRRFRRYNPPEIWKMVPEPVDNESYRVMQDYLIHFIIQEATKRGLPIQIHTGLQEGNENIVANSHPELLTNLFMEYKEAKFDIFHGSWPYSEVLGALAKNFPNVYIDMCWMHIISPSRSRSALSDWLDEVPANKIMGYGGDYLFVEGSYGHSVIAREDIAMVLAEKVDDGFYSLDQAKKYARWMLRENAEKLFFKPRT